MILEVPKPVQIFSVVAAGLCVGSFLNVVIARVPRGRSIVHPSSRCGFCRSGISAWRNVPLLGFLSSAGRCSRCGVAYSVRYPVIEALTPIVFLANWSLYGWSAALLFYSLFCAALIAISFIDLEFRIIPDSMSLGGWAVALILSALSVPGFPTDLISAVTGSLLGAAGFWLISRIFYFVTHEEGLGFGDVKVVGFMGAMLGWRGVISAIFVGSILGTVIGIFNMTVHKKTKRAPIAFGPFLSIGAMVVVFQLDPFWWAWR